jgi:F-type H+-transporting ATPase subunit b
MSDRVGKLLVALVVAGVCLVFALPVQAAEEGIDYNKPPLEFILPTFLFSLVLFVLFILVMRKFAWGPLIERLDEREARVVQAERQAEQAMQDVEKLRQECERQLEEAQVQVKEIVSRARAEGEDRKREIITQAEQDAQRIKEEALAELAAAREQALEELNRVVDEQVAMATEHIAGRSL